jgi:HSP20 family protein
MNLPNQLRKSRNEIWGNDPFLRRSQLQNQMDEFFQEVSGIPAFPEAWSTPTFLPSCEVKEVDEHYILSIDLPGMRKEEIKVEVKGNQLSISGERREENKEKKKGSYRSERSYGFFERTFALPEEVKAEQITTEYADGVLSIAIPKFTAARAQQVKIGESKPGLFDQLLKRGQKAVGLKDAVRAG